MSEALPLQSVAGGKFMLESVLYFIIWLKLED